MDRRQFHKMCSSLLAGAACMSREAIGSNAKNYPPSVLVDTQGNPLEFGSLVVGSSHVFHYPYVTTPCFLLRLEPGNNKKAQLTDRAGQTYEWQGGAGKDGSLVAFSAICSHKMSHPARPISHINFRPDKNLISCCSEHSLYDPSAGAQVLGGPATQPLAAISLTVNDAGQIAATGSYGGDMYDEFLVKFGFRLSMEHGVKDPSSLVGETTEALPATEFSRQQIRC